MMTTPWSAPEPGLDLVLMVNMTEESRRTRDDNNNNKKNEDDGDFIINIVIK